MMPNILNITQDLIGNRKVVMLGPSTCEDYFRGIFLPTKKEILSCLIPDELSCSRIAPKGEHACEVVDIIMYSLPKFIRMLYNNAYPAMEMMCSHNTLYASHMWDSICKRYAEYTKPFTSRDGDRWLVWLADVLEAQYWR